MNAPTRPAIIWHGAKWQCARWIMSHMPPHQGYTEAYGGGAGVLLQKPRVQHEVYNDLDDEVVNLFEVLRNPKQARNLRTSVQLTPYSRREFERATRPTASPVERARRLLVRSHMGRGSDSASKSSATTFRVSTSQHTARARVWANWQGEIEAYTARLAGVVIERRPAIKVLEQYDNAQTLHYVDPPYVHASRKAPQRGYRYEMDNADHAALAKVLRGLDGFVLLSGYASALYAKLYKGWRTARTIVRDSQQQEREEVLWLSPRTYEALHADMFSPTRKARA